LEIKNVIAAVEAMLFASGEPLPKIRLEETLGLNESELNAALEFLDQRYGVPESGLRLLRLGDLLQISTAPEYGEAVRAVLEVKRNAPLSQAALEVLAVVAYNQPVTRSFVEQVRGVDCSGVMTSLLNKGLIEEKGRLELPGRPLLYGTTPDFLRCMGISAIEELPRPARPAEDSVVLPEPDVQEEDG